MFYSSHHLQPRLHVTQEVSLNESRQTRQQSRVAFVSNASFDFHSVWVELSSRRWNFSPPLFETWRHFWRGNSDTDKERRWNIRFWTSYVLGQDVLGWLQKSKWESVTGKRQVKFWLVHVLKYDSGQKRQDPGLLAQAAASGLALNSVELRSIRTSARASTWQSHNLPSCNSHSLHRVSGFCFPQDKTAAEHQQQTLWNVRGISAARRTTLGFLSLAAFVKNQRRFILGWESVFPQRCVSFV